MSKSYFRPLVQTGPAPDDAVRLAGGWTWFTHVEHLRRAANPEVLSAKALPPDQRANLTGPRTVITGLSFDRPAIMGILNVTPDSFSDGGRFLRPQAAVTHAQAMAAEGADILDIGGESTRPGADFVPAEDEISRTAPVIAALAAADCRVPISIDTRKAAVAEAALKSGADLVNDVSAMGFDPDMAEFVAASQAPVCLMHAQGTPDVMQHDPSYRDVLLDVYDFLDGKLNQAALAGIPRSRIIVDPGIGFGKNLNHNLQLLQGVSLFHSLGCAVLVGASRKRFIGTITGVDEAGDRLAGSLAVALHLAAQGVQILRVHDISETRQALTMAQRIWEES